MKVLLIEPIKHDYIPLAFAKLNGFHKAKNDEVKFIIGEQYFEVKDYNPDIIYITTLFIWEKDLCFRIIDYYSKLFPNAKIKVGGINATLLYNKYIEKYKNVRNIEIVKGMVNYLEEQKPDFSLFNVNYSLVYSTKGCINKCPYCAVWQLEPNFIEIKNWYDYIDTTKSKIVFMDNNFLCASKKHITEVLKKCEELKIPIDFNQALDCKYFTDEIGKLFQNVEIHPLRFSFDSKRHEPDIANAIQVALKYKKNDICIFILYNFNELPEEIWERIEIIISAIEVIKPKTNNVYLFPMKFQPLFDTKKGEYIGKHWSKEKIHNFRMEILNKYFSNGVVRFDNREHFYRTFGKSKEEFLNLIKEKPPKEKPLSNFF